MPHTLPEDIRKFIAMSVSSIPHLEALLMFRYDPEREWDVPTVAARLYTGEQRVNEILRDLLESGFLQMSKKTGWRYRYAPSHDLGAMTDRLADLYSSNLIAVTELVHQREKSKAQQLADAFLFRREK
ncbi:MAG TPA: hypothetical protein VNX25_08585 [Verrucomicrobiae bacterium]|nr:hypothetical protein [Verrucomicrobiae bacterium]